MRKQNKEIQLTSYDALLGIEEERTDKVMEASLSELYPFKKHPFQVRDDEKMEETVDSIKNYGVLIPGLVRPRAGGGYELIAGHRRKRGSELAGKTTMPIIVRNYTDDEAVVIMVDSNIQRENLLPSEKAFAYRMKMEALKHQGKKGKNSAKEIGEKAGDNGRKVQRYIRLTYLIQELLDAVDIKKIPILAGADLSFLSEEEQNWVLKAINDNHKYPSGAVAGQLKDYSKNGELTKALVTLLLKGKEAESIQVVIKKERIREYFPRNYDKLEIEEVIFSLLDKWKMEQNDK